MRLCWVVTLLTLLLAVFPAAARDLRNYLESGTIAAGCSQIRSARALADHAKFRAAVPADYATLLNQLDKTAASGFPSASLWEPTAAAPPFDCEPAKGRPAIVLTSGAAVAQDLSPKAIETGRLRAVIDLELLSEDDTLTVRLTGKGIDMSHEIKPQTSRRGPSSFVEEFVVNRQDGIGCPSYCRERIELRSSGARVYEVGVYPAD